MHRRTLSIVFRIVAAIGALITLAATLWSLWTAFAATITAPLGWRIRACLADAFFPLSLMLGFLLATTPRHTWRKIGWWIVALTLVIAFIWGWFVVTPAHPAYAALLTIPWKTPSTTYTTLRIAAAIGVTLTLLDHPTRVRLIEGAYYKHSPDLVAYALYVNSWNLPIAEDLVQDLFITLHTGKHDKALQLDDAALKSYLITALKGLTQTATRSDRRREHRELQAAEPFEKVVRPVDHDYADTELRARLDAAIDKLPPRTAEAFRLVHEFGLRCVDAAQVMGISANTVRGYVKDACQFLRPLFLDVAPSTSPRSLRPEAI